MNTENTSATPTWLTPFLEWVDGLDEERVLFWSQMYFFFFVFMVSFGQIILIENVYLFGDIYVGKFSLGRQAGNSLFLLFPVAAYFIYKRGWPKWEGKTYEIVALVYLAYLVVHLAWAHYPGKAKKAPRYFLLCLMCFYSAQYLLTSRRRIGQMLAVFMGGAVIISVVNLFWYFSGQVHIIKWHWSWKSFLGSYLALVSLLCIYLSLFIDKTWVRVLCGICLLLAVATILVAFCRATYIALPLSLILVSFFYYRKLMVFSVVGTVIGVLLIFFVIGGYPREKLETTMIEYPRKVMSLVGWGKVEKDYKVEDRSMQIRMRKLWPVALDVIRENPILGIGCNSFSKELRTNYSDKYQLLPTDSDAHNTILQIWFSLGIIGVLFFLYLVGLVFRLLRGNIKNLKHPFDRAVNLAIFTWFICHLLEGLVGYYYFKQRYILTMTLMFALVVKMRELGDRENSDVEKQ